VKQPFEATVKAYKTEADYHKDAPGMESAGWEIAAVEEKPWRGEFARILPSSIGDRLFPPQQRTVVTYIRGKL
jgi:hypothetical protein